MIPEDALDRIRRWADRRVPEHVRDQVRLEIDVADPTPDVQELLDEIDRDPTSIFWG